MCTFTAWLEGHPPTKELISAWRDFLLPVIVNSNLAALNCFFRFTGLEACRVKALKLQRRLFRDDRRELIRMEFDRLVGTARELGRERHEAYIYGYPDRTVPAHRERNPRGSGDHLLPPADG